MTMKELAKLANVSVSAVSKAFSEADDISAETKEHIFSLAKEYGCYGRFYKGKYHKKVIAIICPELLNGIYTCVVNCLRELIEAADGMCVVSADNFSASKQAELIDYYISYLKVDGLFVLSLKTPPKKAYDTPIVALYPERIVHIDSVIIDIHGAIQHAVDTVIAYDHKKIAFIGDPFTHRKATYFRDAAAAHRCCEAFIIESSHRFEQAGEDGVRQLLEKYPETSAIICGYDRIAYGAIQQLKAANLQIPQDISVVGVDNLGTSEYIEPALTSFGINIQETCQIAWDLLYRKIRNQGFRATQNIVVQTELVLRESLARRTP